MRLLIIALIFPLLGLTQSGPMVLTNITEQNGLSDDHVQCVLKDKDGFVWVGTADGLNLMDGSTIKIFKRIEGDSNSLAANDILCLSEDVEGNIWIGTPSGLCWYQKTKHQFSSALPPLSPYGAASVVTSIVPGLHSTMWCGTDGGLMKFDPAKRIFTSYFNASLDDPANVIYRNKLHYLMADSKNDLWLCTADGVWSFDPQTFQYKKEFHKDNDSLYTGLFLYVFEDHLHQMWAGNWQYGLKKLDRETGKVINFCDQPGHSTMVNSIKEMREPDGRYVLWLNGDMLAFNPSNSHFFQFTKPLQEAASLYVSPGYQSKDGWIWLVGDKGLFIYSPSRQVFRHTFFSPSLTTQGVLFMEWNKWLLVGAQGESLLKAFDSSGKMERNFSNAICKNYPAGKIAAALSFAQQDENNLWIGNSEGITSINLITEEKKWFSHKENDSTALPRNFIAHLFFDAQKRLWIFPWREGIWQMDPVSGKCTRMIEGFTQEPGHTKRLLIADAVQDDDGNLWMADLDEGIILYDNKTKTFSKPFVKELSESYHIARLYYQNGFCYANTPQCIFKWSTRDRRIQIFRPPPEISKSLYDIAQDHKGNWWIGSKNGLIVFNEKINSFKRYTTTDGLVSNDMDGTLYCKNDGTIMFGTPNYFTSFNPDELTSMTLNERQAVLTDIIVNDKRVDWDSSQTLNLNYRSSNIEFKWALPDYTNPVKNQYYYQLQGIDTGWRYAGNRGEVQFANLSYGKYVILLKAATSNGTTSANTIRIRFIIHAPFWKTRWFIALMVLGVSALFFAVVRYISQRNLKEQLLLLEKEQAIEKERNRISRDMHDDLGSGLTKIAIMSEVVKKQLHEPEKARSQLESISESSRELVDNLQDIIWILNPKNDTLESLAAYIREYAVKFFEAFSIDVQFMYPDKFPAIKLSEETRRNIFLTLKETLNNIAKHAACKKVTISINQTSSSLLLQINDDGKGFDITNTREFSNGLINMKNRIEQVGGTYQLVSEPGKGTAITIVIPAHTFL